MGRLFCLNRPADPLYLSKSFDFFPLETYKSGIPGRTRTVRQLNSRGMSHISHYRILEAVAPARWADSLGEELIRSGAEGVEHVDCSETETLLKAYIPLQVEAGGTRRIADAVETWYAKTTGERLQFVEAACPGIDWVEENRKQWAPFEFIPGVWLAWPDDPSRPPDSVLVRGGAAFGSGRHASTRLCALALRESMETHPGASVADLGAGSAILSILAARWGASQVIAVECDAEAIPFAEENVALNEGASRIAIRCADLNSASGPHPVVVANLTAPVHRERATDIAAAVAPNGTLILGGMLEYQADGVAAAFEPLGFMKARSLSEEGWTTLVLHSVKGSA